MSAREPHKQNLARIENYITELKVRMLELQERIQKQEAAGSNTEISHALFAVLVEHLEILEIRQRQAWKDIRAHQIIVNT